MSKQRSAPRHPIPIKDMLAQERERSNASYRDLTIRSEKAGHPVSYQYLHELVTQGPKGWPKSPETFRGLAAILQVPLNTVVLSFAASFGLEVESSSSPLAERLPQSLDHLNEDVLDAIVQLIRAHSQQP